MLPRCSPKKLAINYCTPMQDGTNKIWNLSLIRNTDVFTHDAKVRVLGKDGKVIREGPPEHRAYRLPEENQERWARITLLQEGLGFDRDLCSHIHVFSRFQY